MQIKACWRALETKLEQEYAYSFFLLQEKDKIDLQFIE
jgi:hypothetical protein